MEVAKMASTLGMQVLAFDPYIQKAEGIRLVDLDTLFKESDFISIHCPLNESTRRLIGEKAFHQMKKRPLIVNTSRGPIIDGTALIEALKGGLISGAGLDVLEKEPLDPQSPMLKMENVIFSPHMGFYSEESIRELNRRTAENVADVLLGKWPRSVVNREVTGKTRAIIASS
jgi:D-3-phosphoglycerate dehydrogenase